MKKNILFGFAACGAMLLSANVATAQEAVAVEEVTITETEAVECGDHFYSERGANWFLQIGAGMELPMTDRIADGQEHHRHITASYNIAFGKWFSPYLAWRIGATGGAYHVDADGYNKAKYINANADLMWDMFNSIAGPKADRVFSIIPFVGVGGTYTWGFDPALASIPDGEGHRKTKEWTLPVSAGIQLRLRLCKYVDFFAEGRVNFYGDNFNNVASGDPIEANVNVYGGFLFNIGGRKYSAYNPCEYLGYINNLNNQVNSLRGELATTSAALAAAEAQLPCPEVVAQEVVVQSPMLTTVRFKIDSSVISDEEMVNVYNMAEWMKANPNVNVVVQGYADKDTGTAAYNMELSQRRGQAVVDALVNYGIDSSRLTIQANGSDVQPYDENNWNRIVIFAQP